MMLVGVFLGSGSPSSTSPSILDFNTIGMDFTTLFPELQQTFFIGDGLTSGGESQAFIVPTGATRLFLGIADAAGFMGDPSWYDDNTGSFEVAVTQPTTGATPTPTATAIPTLPPLPTLPPIPSPTALPTLPPGPTLPPISSPTLPQLPLPLPSPTLQPPPTVIPTLPPLPGGAGAIFGFINDENDDVLQGVTVTLEGADYSESVTTDVDGAFQFNNLSAGDYTLTCDKDGYQTYSQSINVVDGAPQDIGTIVLEVVVKAKISGNVVDIHGDPIENVKIKTKGVKTGYKKTAASDADGFFEFGELDGDTYIIVAKKKGYKRATQTVKLDDGEETEIEIEMKKTSKRIIKKSSER